MSQLYEESIFISIGHRDFQIPREIFSDPGNSPNYFSLGFAVFFSTPTEVFPGLDRDGLLRPPSILPPSVPNRSADTFAELLHLLRGYPLQIRSEEHRAELLGDCRYFHLKGLEQKLIRHHIAYNISRQRSEITLRLEDVRQSGISIIPSTTLDLSPSAFLSYISYARPFVDTKPHDLILEIGDECTILHFSPFNASTSNPSSTGFSKTEARAEFFNEGKKRISKLFEVIATKLNLPTSQPLGLLMKNGGASSAPASPGNTAISEDLVRVVIDPETYISLDGKEWNGDASRADKTEGNTFDGEDAGSSRKRRRIEGGGGDENWVIKTGQWRLRVQNGRNGKGVECLLVAVKLDAVSGEGGRNKKRAFLA